MKTLPRKIGFMALGVLLGSVANIDTARSDDGYSAKGLPLGAFRLYPTLDVTGEYDDNVFRTNAAKQDDVLVRISPAAVLSSDWGRHMLNLHAKADVIRYMDFKSDNRTDWNMGAQTRLDASRDVDFTASADFSELHESRSSPDAAGFQTETTEYRLWEAKGDIAYHPSRMRASAGVGFQDYEFNNTAIMNPLPGPQVIDNHDRNRTVYDVHGRLGYEFSPGYAVFAGGGYNTHNFSRAADRTGANRDKRKRQNTE